MMCCAFAYLAFTAMFLCAMPLVAANQTYAANPVKISKNARLGDILTDSRGMTLYIFTDDRENVSNCYDQCAMEWPPFVTDDRSNMPQNLNGKFGVIKRRDNKLQVTFSGKPLYYYIKDKNPGDTYGQNVENKWFVINPNKTNY